MKQVPPRVNVGAWRKMVTTLLAAYDARLAKRCNFGFVSATPFATGLAKTCTLRVNSFHLLTRRHSVGVG